MASETYECGKCGKNGKREQLRKHFIRTHVSRPNTYEVQIGRDIFPYREDEPVYRYGMENVFDYEHKSAGACDGSYINTDTAHGQTESDKDKEGEEKWGSTSERRKTVDKKEGNSTERKMKSDERKEKGGERKKKSEDREVNRVERNSKSRREGRSAEGKMISNEREGKGRGRKRKSEDREGNDRERNMWEGRDGSMIERRNILRSGEQRVEERRQNYSTPEPDKLKKKPKLTSSRSVDTSTLTKLDPAVTGETSRKKNLEEYGGTGNTQIHNEAQKAASSTVRTEEPGVSFSSEQAYNFGTEPEESAEVKVECDSDIEGQSSRGGTEGMQGVSSQCQEGALVGKINELMQCLEPLKNISKVLIALDHHMRRLLPLVNQIHTGTPSSTEGL